MENSLFTSLRKYKVTPKKDPLENFITEAFVWILRYYPEFSSYYLKAILQKAQIDFQSGNAEWNTQVNFGGVFPDVVCKVDSYTLIFEHKVWAGLHENQLSNYRNYAINNYSKYLLILITANTSQHTQNPDLALCWRDIYNIINDWLSNNPATQNPFMFKSFLELLREEGLGPAAPVSHESILYYLQARHFIPNIVSWVQRASQRNGELLKTLVGGNDYKLYFRHLWGRIGLELHDTWRPCLFIGVMTDWEDHAIPPLYHNSPDFVILLSFEDTLHGYYPSNKNYLDLVEELSKKFFQNENGWQFYNHLEDDEVGEKNSYHPIYIRKPLIELLKGTITAEDQDMRFENAIAEILPTILESKYFHNLRNEYRIPISATI